MAPMLLTFGLTEQEKQRLVKLETSLRAALAQRGLGNRRYLFDAIEKDDGRVIRLLIANYDPIEFKPTDLADELSRTLLILMRKAA